MSTLAHEVASFREWAIIRQSPDYRPDQYSHGAEWECDYPHWQSLYAAVDDLLAAAVKRILTSEELELLLYTLARDNEDEHILQVSVLTIYTRLLSTFVRCAASKDTVRDWI